MGHLFFNCLDFRFFRCVLADFCVLEIVLIGVDFTLNEFVCVSNPLAACHLCTREKVTFVSMTAVTAITNMASQTGNRGPRRRRKFALHVPGKALLPLTTAERRFRWRRVAVTHFTTREQSTNELITPI